MNFPVSVSGIYHSPLSVLKGIDIFNCNCGERILSVPRVPELNALIGENRIRKDSPLAGTEIRFLRKNMGFTGKRLSEIMGVDNATISRWERDFQKSAKAHDHFIRLLFIIEKRVSADQATFDIEEVFSYNMSQKDKRQTRKIIYDHIELLSC